MIDRNHPAVEAAAMTLYADRAELEGWNDTWESEDERVRSNWRVHALEVLTAAREHYTADDLRNTPAGRELMAETWSKFQEHYATEWEEAYPEDIFPSPAPHTLEEA